MKGVLLLSGFLLGLFISNYLHCQCTPDPTCNDINNPGEVCPGDLPDAYVNQYYSQVLTIIPPANAIINGQTVNIAKIKLTNVENLPQGMNYQCNPLNCEFTVTNPLTRYCAILQGTPSQPGIYQLKIHVVPYIMVFGVPTAMPEQVDDTSLVLIVHESSNVDVLNTNEFFVNIIHNNSNFNFLINYPDFVTNIAFILVYDITGKIIHKEKIKLKKGLNNFECKLNYLSNGTYICKIIVDKYTVIKKFTH
ncbi:MAG: T9SS type A sorting domain-containing protein [Bacteroidales bacterium]|nr:T9SS type A sorting domain-containing protein [Bacteroidales bacterium]